MATLRIFISHSHADIEWCRPFVAALREQGHDPWLDDSNLKLGDPWPMEIEQELLARDIFMLIVTPESMKSDWVRRELAVAL